MDKINQKLQDNYEDALFALLMDNYATEEGKHLLDLANQLNSDKTYTLPAEMEKNGLRTIRKAFRKKNLRYSAKLTGKVLSKVAILVLILDIAFGISFFSVEAFRIEVLNMALNYQETHTTIRFVSEDEATSSQYTAKDLQNVLPNTYVLESYEDTPTGEYALFIGGDGKRIMWDAEPISTTLNLDTEDADQVNNICVDGNDGIIVEKKGISTITWGDVSTQKMYCIIADMSSEELIMLVEQLTG